MKNEQVRQLIFTKMKEIGWTLEEPFEDYLETHMETIEMVLREYWAEEMENPLTNALEFVIDLLRAFTERDIEVVKYKTYMQESPRSHQQQAAAYQQAITAARNGGKNCLGCHEHTMVSRTDSGCCHRDESRKDILDVCMDWKVARRFANEI